MVTLTRRKLVAMIVLFIVVLVLLLWLLVFRGRKPKDTTVHLEGTLTQVFTDCESSLRLGPKGEVISDKAVSCDGGSYIVIDNRTQVYTASGDTAAENVYDKHQKSWKPGMHAVVTASTIDAAPGLTYYTLNCPTCSVEAK